MGFKAFNGVLVHSRKFQRASVSFKCNLPGARCLLGFLRGLMHFRGF